MPDISKPDSSSQDASVQQVLIYTTPICGYCNAAKSLLKARGFSYTEYDVSVDAARYQEMLALSTQRTVPQIVIGGQHIGGYTELVQHFKNQAAK